MAEETQKEKSVWEKYIQTILLTLITTAIIGGVTTIISIDKKLIAIEAHDEARTEKIDKLESIQNKEQIDLFDLKGEVSNLKQILNDRKEAERIAPRYR